MSFGTTPYYTEQSTVHKERTIYTVIDHYRINTLKRALDKEAGVQTSPENLYSIIESDSSLRINPVQAYFKPYR